MLPCARPILGRRLAHPRRNHMTNIIQRSALVVCGVGTLAGAQDPKPPKPDTAKLEGVRVTAPRVERPRITPLQALTLPLTASVTAQRIDQTVNVMDVEDAVKY